MERGVAPGNYWRRDTDGNDNLGATYRSIAAGMEMRAERDGSGSLINVHKMSIMNGTVADISIIYFQGRFGGGERQNYCVSDLD